MRDGDHSAYRSVHLDFHTPEWVRGVGRDFDAEQFADTIAAAHIREITCFGKCAYGWFYYRTEAGPAHPGLGRDLLREQVEALHARNVRVLAHYSVGLDEYVYARQEDWRQRDADGTAIRPRPDYWGMLCLNSPYVAERVLPQLRDLVQTCPVDGVFLDVVHFHQRPLSCFCTYCQRAYRVRVDRELTPAEAAAHPQQFERFRLDSVCAFLATAAGAIRERNPGVVVTANSHGGHAGSDRRLVQAMSYAIIEARTESDYSIQGLQARYARNQPAPFQIMTTRFCSHWGDFTLKPVVELQFEAAQIVMNGGHVSIGDHLYPDGRLEPATDERIGETYRFVEAREPFVIGADVVPDVAVLATRAGAALSAADRILLQQHRQADLLDEPALLERIDAYAGLLVPERAAISAEAAVRVRDYVRAGGQLLITGESPPGGHANLLGEVLGVEWVGSSPYSVHYLTFEDGSPLAPSLPAFPLVLQSSFAHIHPVADDVQRVARVTVPMTERTPDRFFSHVHAPPGEVSRFPGAILRRYGAGAVLYFPFRLLEAYWATNHWWLRDLLSTAVQLLVPDAPFSLDAGPDVEATLFRRGNEFFLHLLQFHAGRATGGGHAPIEAVPLRRNVAVRVRVPDAVQVRAVTWEPQQQQLPWRREGNDVHVVVPELDLHGLLHVR